MLPSTESLRCFVAAAKLLNFRAAASSVALTPAAFGQRIKLLEEQLGLELFVRSTRSMQLSDGGRSLLPHAERCLLAADECVRSVARSGTRGTIEFTIGTRHELGISWVLPQLDTLIAEHPSLQFHLYFGSGIDLLRAIRTMSVDCAIGSFRVTDSKIDSIRLHREEYVFVAQEALSCREPLTQVEHASRHTLLDIDGELPLFRYWSDSPTQRDRTQPAQFRSVVRLGTIEAIRQRALAGAGVAVLPRYLVEEDIATKKLVVLVPKWPPLHDYFRLFFRADDPRRSTFEAIASTMLKVPLRR